MPVFPLHALIGNTVICAGNMETTVGQCLKFACNPALKLNHTFHFCVTTEFFPALHHKDFPVPFKSDTTVSIRCNTCRKCHQDQRRQWLDVPGKSNSLKAASVMKVGNISSHAILQEQTRRTFTSGTKHFV